MKKLIWEQDGATAVEYGLLTALIALVMAGGAVVVGNALNELLGDPGSAVMAQSEAGVMPTPSPSYGP
jgi:Flp pilus assembly pilin Flp